MPSADKPKKVTKRQHYVPQFYLRQWCDDEGGFYPIKVEERTPPKIKIFERKSDPSRFCYENFFYAQHTGQEDEISQNIERGFAEIEALLSVEIPKIERKILNSEQITEVDKYRLSELMIFLWIRGKSHRDQSQKMIEKLFKDINKLQMPYIDKDPKMKMLMQEKGITKEEMIEFAERGEYTVDVGNMQHLALFKEMYGFCNMLSNKYWKICISRDGKFITTDAPYLDKSLSRHFMGNHFMVREQSFVLSPRVIIVTRYPRNNSKKNIVRKDITGNLALIQQMNCHNLMQSIRFGFHRERDHLKELERFIDYLYQNRDKLRSEMAEED